MEIFVKVMSEWQHHLSSRCHLVLLGGVTTLYGAVACSIEPVHLGHYCLLVGSISGGI